MNDKDEINKLLDENKELKKDLVYFKRENKRNFWYAISAILGIIIWVIISPFVVPAEVSCQSNASSQTINTSK